MVTISFGLLNVSHVHPPGEGDGGVAVVLPAGRHYYERHSGLSRPQPGHGPQDDKCAYQYVTLQPEASHDRLGGLLGGLRHLLDSLSVPMRFRMELVTNMDILAVLATHFFIIVERNQLTSNTGIKYRAGTKL